MIPKKGETGRDEDFSSVVQLLFSFHCLYIVRVWIY